MPAVKSRYSAPSAVRIVLPEPDTISRSVVRNQTSLRCEPMLNSSCSARHDDAAGVSAAPDRMREANPRALDLPRPGLAPKLVDQLDDLAERRRAERLALRQQAAARVHGAGAPELGRSRCEQGSLLARRAQV